jgi:excisionase family DNA binding protein
MAVWIGRDAAPPVRPTWFISWQAVSELVSPGATETLERLLSIEDVADVLRISQRGVYRLIGRGELPTVKIGGLTRIEPQQLKSYIAERRQLSDKEPA